ncbi:queuosine biosynthesis family protein [Mycobacterium xenopi 3993]|nr:queuosine biosynthesis family protein [Mycobacterium xenopi 3993]
MFARHAGSAEIPSAARPFTTELVTALVAAGVVIAPVTLHAGVSSAEAGEPPAPERFEVSSRTAHLVNLAHATGSRVIAVGTTVTGHLSPPRARTVSCGRPRAGRIWCWVRITGPAWSMA